MSERSQSPSVFIAKALQRFVPASGLALDLACGRGRHARIAAARGFQVVALDRNRGHLTELSCAEAVPEARIHCVCADLEQDHTLPFADSAFALVIVCRYLHRPLMAAIAHALAPNATLLYETFLRDQRLLGWGPRRDEYLLQRGELPALFPGLEILDYDEGENEDPRPAQTARLIARRGAG